jgi:hypothetical protein
METEEITLSAPEKPSFLSLLTELFASSFLILFHESLQKCRAADRKSFARYKSVG